MKEVKRAVLIVFGGESAEHDISIITAITMYKKYRLGTAQIQLVYCSRGGKFFVGAGLDDFQTYKNFDERKFKEVAFLQGEKFLYLKKKNKMIKFLDIDFVVNCFHGGAGEDGRFCALLDQSQIPSSSSDYKALGIAMDKYYTKLAALAMDVPTIDFFVFTREEWINGREKVLQQIVQFDFPVVVKPVCQGSSIGVSFAGSLDEFENAVSLGLKFGYSILVERAITTKREFNCCVVRTPEGKLLARVDEPVSDKVIITFKDKYLGGKPGGKSTKRKGALALGMQSQARESREKLTQKQKAVLVKHSRVLYDNLDMNGVVRFDYIMDTTKEKVYLGEINAIPGSMGYYFFEDMNLLELVYNASKSYWAKRFSLDNSLAPGIFS